MLDRKIIKKTSKPKGMLRNGINYSFTFNLNNDHQYFEENDVRRIRCIYKTVNKIGTLLDKVSTFVLHPEFSTPDPYKCLDGSRRKKVLNIGVNTAPRYHFHGTICFNNVAYFYYQTFRKLLTYGLWEIDTISNKKIWTTYCTKDKSVMKPFLKTFNIDYLFKNKHLKTQKMSLKKTRVSFDIDDYTV